ATDARRERLGSEAFAHAISRRSGQPRAQGWLTKQRDHRADQRLPVSRIDDETVALVGDDFFRGAARRDTWHGCRHRLEVHEAETFISARHHETDGVTVQRRQPSCIHAARERNALGTYAVGLLAQALEIVSPTD